MYVGDKMIREKDGFVFTVREVSHWSLIRCEESKEETHVKWIGDEYFVGHDGNGYRLKEDRP